MPAGMTVRARTAQDVRGIGWWWWAAAIGLGLGLVAALEPDLAVGSVLVVMAMIGFARSSHRTERLVALYWLAYAVYSIVFFGLIIRFGFYPFYAAFLVSVAVALVRGELRVDAVSAWLYVGFMITVAWSFLPFGEPIDSDVIQRLLAYLVGGLVYLQFRSTDGLRPVATMAVVTSVVVAAFVIFRSVESGFAYRGGVDANPNTVARMVGYGALITFAWLLAGGSDAFRRWRRLLLVPVLLLMTYSLMLLASRGMVISLTIALCVMLLRAFIENRRAGAVVLVLAAVAGSAIVLPGGEALITRFTASDENVASAGSRIPIWEVTLESLAAGNVVQLLFGHGFDSSKPVVERRFLGQTSIHNTYLHFLYEFGLFSLLFHVALLAYLAIRAWTLSGRFGLAMLGLVSYMSIESLSGDIASLFDYWIVLGFVAAIGHWGPAAALVRRTGRSESTATPR